MRAPRAPDRTCNSERAESTRKRNQSTAGNTAREMASRGRREVKDKE